MNNCSGSSQVCLNNRRLSPVPLHKVGVSSKTRVTTVNGTETPTDFGNIQWATISSLKKYTAKNSEEYFPVKTATKR